MSSNYMATVVRIGHIRPHSNADRLVCTTIFGNNIIVGKDTKEGDLGIFFPMESQIGMDFAVANDLIRRKDPETGKSAGGMFDQNRRVRCQKFRGEKSMGFWIPIDSIRKTFEHLGLEVPVLNEGDEFEILQGVDIAKKYIPITRNSGEANKQKQQKKKPSRLVENQFKFHFDTAQLGKNIHRITPDTLVSASWKLHGTSAVASHVLVKRKLSLLERLLRWSGVQIQDTEYDYLFSSRKVVKNDFIQHPGYFGYDLWNEAGQRFVGLLRKGESVYYEIVGFLPNGKQIQADYDYGCAPGEYKIYIYRITNTNVDGDVVELSWHQVRQRAREWGMETCPHIFDGYAGNMFKDLSPAEAHWNDMFLERLKATYVYDQDSIFCKNQVPEEGIVLRIEGTEVENFKLKAFRFYEYETKLIDKGNVDLETEESEDDS